METLYVLYDTRCPLSLWLRNWADEQPTFVRLVFVAAGSADAERVAPGLTGRTVAVEDLLAVGDGGEVYRGDSAWIMCFYATEEYREWASRLASPALRPVARKAFALLARRQLRASAWIGLSDHVLVAMLSRFEAPPSNVAASGLQKIHSMVAGEEPRDTSTGR